MTHDELRAKIQHYNWVEANDLIQAIDAVVELHKPNDFGNCTACGLSPTNTLVVYPCKTIKSIEKELL
jgi:3-polyprenyl-4-hydroxybenzoate decarboxylase